MAIGPIIDKQYRYNKNPFKIDKGKGVFSFKNPKKNINVYPNTHGLETKDIGWKQLIGPDKEIHEDGINYILEKYSTIKIHECVQETKIDCILNSIRNLTDGWKSGVEALEKCKGDNSLGLVAKYIAKATTTNTFIGNIINGLDKFKGTNLENENALKLTYALQYCLMNREVNNTYELPYDSSQLYQTNGTDGWKNEVSEFSGTSSNSLLGKALNFMGTQIRLISEPIWQGTSQSSTTQIQVKVNLFNDYGPSAMENFIFIHNIMPNNLYLQYGLLQQAPSYYDVNIEGNRRFPLCKGSFICNGKGIFREFDVKNLTLQTTSYDTIKKICQKTGHKLRIPDVYELELNFQSLLPDSFNDFLYYWYMEESAMTPVESSQFNSKTMLQNFRKIVKEGTDNYSSISDDKVEDISKQIETKDTTDEAIKKVLDKK